MKKVLRFKHWHLFLLIGLCGAWTSPSPLKEIINSIALITFLIWIYSIGYYGQQKIKNSQTDSNGLNHFRLNIIFIPVLIIIIQSLSHYSDNSFGLLDIILIPAGLYLVYAMFQVIIFAMKTLTTIEKNKEAKFGDWIINLMLTLIFLIGIWFIQPKVNKLIGEK